MDSTNTDIWRLYLISVIENTEIAIKADRIYEKIDWDIEITNEEAEWISSYENNLIEALNGKTRL